MPDSPRQLKQVTFEQADVVGTVTPSTEMTESDRCELWYQHSDMELFKNQARELSRSIREGEASLEHPILDASADLALVGTNDCARGLEHRVLIERQMNKFLVMRTILQAQGHKCPDQLAVVASRCSAWAKEVALCTGFQDFFQAYNPGMAILVPSTPVIEFPLTTTHKRRAPAQADKSPPHKKARVFLQFH